MNIIITGAAALAAGIAAGYLLRKMYAGLKTNSAETLSKKIIAEAYAEAEAKKKEGLQEVKERMEAGKPGGGFIICTAHNNCSRDTAQHIFCERLFYRFQLAGNLPIDDLDTGVGEDAKVPDYRFEPAADYRILPYRLDTP